VMLGARVEGAGARFGAYVTTAERCAVRLFDASGRALATHAMRDRGDGQFDLFVDGVGAGARYKFVLGEQELPDPYARFLPDGVHGAAMVVEPGHRFLHPLPEPRPLSQHVFYELHVGCFSPEGTYAGAAAKLDRLVDLGVTAVELMPLAAFPGQRGWGYDGVALYAPFAPYGTPDELRAFVDAAHARGLAVFLDVVYNHFGASGNYLGAYSADYFATGRQTPWGAGPSFDHPAMRRYIVENARYWLEEFRFDGLRLDAIHAISDPSEEHIVRAITRMAHALAPRRLVIDEDERNDPACLDQLGCDAVWADDFHHQMHVTLTGEHDGYYAAFEPGVAGMAAVIERGWLYEGQRYEPWDAPRGKSARAVAVERLVYCIQNHDQIGNRAFGSRLCHDVSLDAYRLASAVLLFLPMTPLLFMGQEWAASAPFQYFTDHGADIGAQVSAGRRQEFARFAAFSDPAVRETIPDPQAEATFLRSRLDWNERTRASHADVLSLYQRLLALRRTDSVLRVADRAGLSAEARAEVLVVRRRHGDQERVLIANFSDRPFELASFDGRVLIATRELSRDGFLPEHAALVLG
jgi:maltooligosyltrehalose trehalohydrolase